MSRPLPPAAALPGFIAGEHRLQRAWLVDDLQRAVQRASRRRGLGPWFLQQAFTPRNARCYGKPSDLLISLAFAFAGDTMLELVQQHSTHASPFRDAVPRRTRRHHVGIATSCFDDVLGRYLDSGHTPVYSAEPSGRLVMLQAPAGPLLLELLEWTPQRRALFEGIRRAAIGWDGTRPVRPLTDALASADALE